MFLCGGDSIVRNRDAVARSLRDTLVLSFLDSPLQGKKRTCHVWALNGNSSGGDALENLTAHGVD